MAIIENGINGGFKGKVGSVTGYYANGKWVIRGLRKSTKKNKIGTEKQKASRRNFTTMQEFLKPLLYFIRIGFNIESKKRMMTAHNVAKSYNMLNAMTPDGKIDYSKVSLTYGKIMGAEEPRITIDETHVHISWTNNFGADNERYVDQAMIIIYDVENKFTHFETAGEKRFKCADSIKLWKFKNPPNLHIWISFISEDRQDISMSTYCGSFIASKQN
jgi:hypothetical protein